MPSISLSSGTIHYREQGQGVPLVLLHANPGDSRDFDAVIDTFAGQYRVLALDWPGYGESDLPDDLESVDVLFFYKALREFLTALELSSALFIGNSLGGNVAARLAAESPELVKGLVLVAPGGFTEPNFISRNFCKFQSGRFSIPPYRFARLYLKHRTATTQAMLDRASTTQANVSQIALNRAVWRSFGNPENDLRAIAPSIKSPTLLLFGKSDPVIRSSKDGKVASRCIPSADFVELPSGHAPFAEIPELFLTEVLPFLEARCG